MTGDKKTNTADKPQKLYRRGSGVPNPVDVHVGSRIRQRRTLLGMSQEKLAQELDISFQQVQKYESGKNRLSASRLYQIAKIVDTPVSYFFKDIPTKDVKNILPPEYASGLSDNDQADFGGKDNNDHLLQEKESRALLRAYFSVEDPEKRQELLKLFKTMVKTISN